MAVVRKVIYGSVSEAGELGHRMILVLIGMMILVKDQNRSDYQSQNSTIPMFYWKDDTNNI